MAISNKKLTALIRHYFAHHEVTLSDIPGVCVGYTACAITAAFLGKQQLGRFYQRMIMLKTYEYRPGDLVKDILHAKEKLRIYQLAGFGQVSYEEELLAELPYFFEAVWLYQWPYDFYELSGTYKKQSFYQMQELLAPNMLTSSIKKLHRSYLAISQAEMLSYLNELELILHKPQVMMISNGYHRFALIYHAKVNCWSVLDIERKDSTMPVLNKLQVMEEICIGSYSILRVDFLCQSLDLGLQASIQKLEQAITQAEIFNLEFRHTNLLYLAYKARDIDVISKLEESGARLPLNSAMNAIDTVVELGRVDTFKWLVENKFVTNQNAQRLFNIACAYGQQDLCEFMLNESDLSVDINFETEQGVSALFIAAKHGQDTLCIWLVNQRANTSSSKLGSFTVWLKNCLNNDRLALKIESLELINASRTLRLLNGRSPFSSQAKTKSMPIHTGSLSPSI